MYSKLQQPTTTTVTITVTIHLSSGYRQRYQTFFNNFISLWTGWSNNSNPTSTIIIISLTRYILNWYLSLQCHTFANNDPSLLSSRTLLFPRRCGGEGTVKSSSFPNVPTPPLSGLDVTHVMITCAVVLRPSIIYRAIIIKLTDRFPSVRKGKEQGGENWEYRR